MLVCYLFWGVVVSVRNSVNGNSSQFKSVFLTQRKSCYCFLQAKCYSTLALSAVVMNHISFHFFLLFSLLKSTDLVHAVFPKLLHQLRLKTKWIRFHSHHHLLEYYMCVLREKGIFTESFCMVCIFLIFGVFWLFSNAGSRFCFNFVLSPA